MRSFIDLAKRKWVVEVTVSTVERVRALTEVDLLTIDVSDLAARLVSDPVLLCNVLYSVCKPQADKEDVTDEEFGTGLGGDALDEAVEALLGAMLDFFPQRRRTVFETALEKMRRLETVAHETVMARIQETDFEAELIRQIQQTETTPGNTSTS